MSKCVLTNSLNILCFLTCLFLSLSSFLYFVAFYSSIFFAPPLLFCISRVAAFYWVIGLFLILLSVWSITPFPPLPFDWFAPHPLLAWQGTDLMHNHVLADVDQSCVDAVGCRGSGFPSDQSEDSDYDSIWITRTNRMGSISRKSSCSDQHHIIAFYSLYTLNWKSCIDWAYLVSHRFLGIFFAQAQVKGRVSNLWKRF